MPWMICFSSSYLSPSPTSPSSSAMASTMSLTLSVPGVIFIVMLEILARPPLWVHIAVGIPVLILTTVLPLRPIKGWLVAAQYVTKAQEAGTADLWAKLHGEGRDERRD